MSDPRIRLARRREIEGLQAVEVDSGALFRDVGMDDIAEGDALPLALLADAQAADLLWVAADADDRPVGFLSAIVEGCALFVQQMSVLRSHQRQGLGRALMDAAAERARAEGLDALTLTTFRDVPWNAPLYARLGFREVRDDEPLAPALRTRLSQEALTGLDASKRLGMVREV